MSTLICRHLIVNRNITNRSLMNLGIMLMNTIPISRGQERRAVRSPTSTHTDTLEG